MNIEQFKAFCKNLEMNIDWLNYSKIISSTSKDFELNKPTGRFDKSEIHSFVLEKYSSNYLKYVDLPGIDFICPSGNIKIEDKSSTWMFQGPAKKKKKLSFKKNIHVQMKNTRNGSNINSEQDYIDSVPWDVLMLRQTCEDSTKHFVALLRKEDVSRDEIKITKDQIQLNVKCSKLNFIYHGNNNKKIKIFPESFKVKKRQAILRYIQDVFETTQDEQ